MTSPLNEAAVEQAAIDWMKGLGWQHAYGPDIGPLRGIVWSKSRAHS